MQSLRQVLGAIARDQRIETYISSGLPPGVKATDLCIVSKVGGRPQLCCLFDDGLWRCPEGMECEEVTASSGLKRRVCNLTWKVPTKPAPDDPPSLSAELRTNPCCGTGVDVGFSQIGAQPYAISSWYGGYNTPGYGMTAMGAVPQYGGGYNYTQILNRPPCTLCPTGAGVAKTGVPNPLPGGNRIGGRRARRRTVTCTEFCSHLHKTGSAAWGHCFFNCEEGEKRLKEVTWVPPPAPDPVRPVPTFAARRPGFPSGRPRIMARDMLRNPTFAVVS